MRTNYTETDPVKLWRWYIQLQQAEATFPTSKSDLALGPVYHQKTERVEAHILVCFLALALWCTLEMWMRAKGPGTRARSTQSPDPFEANGDIAAIKKHRVAEFRNHLLEKV